MFKDLVRGIKTYSGVFEIMSKLGLWKYFIVPMIISVVTAIAIGFSAYGFSDNIGQYIAKIWVWEWGSETFRTVSDILGGIMIVALGLILYKHIVMALSAPFMSPVSEKIEAHLVGENSEYRKTTFGAQLWRGIRINVRNLSLELLFSIPIFILGFFPVIGLIAPIILFFMQAYYAGFGNMDYTLERRLNYSESIRFVGRRKGLAIGNGAVFMAMLFIPVIGFIIVLPLSVTAASIQTIEVLHPQLKQ
ncbi:MAG: EI24 domain-containing protein [Gilvibacter sp.]